MAATKVLNIVELLEDILLRIDEKTLLLSQRVNHKFKATIDGSIQLQRKLFFQQAPADYEGDETDIAEALNPLLPWEELPWENRDDLLFFLNQPRPIPDEHHVGFILWHNQVDYIPDYTLWWLGIDIRGNRWTGEESWRKMYLFREGHAVLTAHAERQNKHIGQVEQYPRQQDKYEDWDKGNGRSTMGEWFEKAKAMAVARGYMPRDGERKGTRKVKKVKR